jgi:hypothetical protein
MACSQRRRRQIARSPRATRTGARRSVMGRAFARPCLINRQRMEKSLSHCGRVLDAMEMIGQSDPSIDVEAVASPHTADRFAQEIDVSHQRVPPPFQQVHREEIAPARDSIPLGVRHSRLFTPIPYPTRKPHLNNPIEGRMRTAVRNPPNPPYRHAERGSNRLFDVRFKPHRCPSQ